MEIICFHNPDEENGFLSNWYQNVLFRLYMKNKSMNNKTGKFKYV